MRTPLRDETAARILEANGSPLWHYLAPLGDWPAWRADIESRGGDYLAVESVAHLYVWSTSPPPMRTGELVRAPAATAAAALRLILAAGVRGLGDVRLSERFADVMYRALPGTGQR